MKKYFAILLFLCLAIKPAYKIGYVAYFKLNIDTIIEKYCVNKAKPMMKCNGKCHLAKKLSFSQNTDTSNSDKLIARSLSEAFFPVYFETIKEFQLQNTMETSQISPWQINSDYNISLSVSSPPPIVYIALI